MKKQKATRRPKSKPKQKRKMNWLGIFLIGLVAFVAIKITWMMWTAPRPTEVIGLKSDAQMYFPPNLRTPAGPFLKDSTIAALFPIVESRIPQYRGLMNEIRNGHTVRLNVVFQTHQGSFGDSALNSVDAVVMKSQNSTWHLLRKLKPKILVLEGFPFTVVTPANYQRAEYDASNGSGHPMTWEQAGEYVHQQYETNGGLAYAFQNPSCKTFGFEDDNLVLLQGRVISMGYANYPQGSPAPTNAELDTLFRRFDYDLRYLRSIQAVACAVKQANLSHNSLATIVIGGGHHDDIAEIMRATRIRGKFYDATP